MNIFKHKTIIKTYQLLIFMSFCSTFYLLFQKEWLHFIISFPIGCITTMFIYFGLEWVFEGKKEVKQ